MYLGIDLGTSGVKLLLLNGAQTLVATADVAVPQHRPAHLPLGHRRVQRGVDEAVGHPRTQRQGHRPHELRLDLANQHPRQHIGRGQQRHVHGHGDGRDQQERLGVNGLLLTFDVHLGHDAWHQHPKRRGQQHPQTLANAESHVEIRRGTEIAAAHHQEFASVFQQGVGQHQPLD